jgi:lipopolysaccharide heptosyltransferase II
METRMFRQICSSQLASLTPERICVIKPSALGDVVQSLPLLPILKHRYPSARISWVISRELSDLLVGHPCLDEIIPFDRRGGWSPWRRLLSKLSSGRFDLVFDLQGLLRTGVMTLATGARVRVGLQTAREGASLATNCEISGTTKVTPAHARLWRVAEVLGLGEFPKQTQVVTSSADQDWANQLLAHLPRPVIAVHPGAGWETKRWPVDKFAELLNRSARHWGSSTIILGSRGERPDAERLEQLLRSAAGDTDVGIGPRATSVTNLAGMTTLKQLSALLARVDLVVSNDSGPMHLAAGLGTPTLCIFTCTSAPRSGPPGNQHELVSTAVACAASYCKRCPHTGAGHLACFTELAVERVWNGLQRLIEKNGIPSNRTDRAA